MAKLNRIKCILKLDSAKKNCKLHTPQNIFSSKEFYLRNKCDLWLFIVISKLREKSLSTDSQEVIDQTVRCRYVVANVYQKELRVENTLCTC